MKPKQPGLASRRRWKFRSGGSKTETRILPQFQLRRRPLLSESSVTNIYHCTETRNVDGRVGDKETTKLKHYAAKVVSKSALEDSPMRKQQRKNVKIYRRLRHPHVCTFHSYFETEDHCFLVMEYCPHGDLKTLLRRRRRLTEPEVAYYLGQILEALHYLHHKKMCCGHVQLAHCLIDRQGQVKLGGWGGVHGRQQLEYCAPELVCGGQDTSVEADVWSLGVCLYALLVGQTPFSGPDRTTTIQRVVENQYPSDDVMISNVAWELIGGLLRTSPTDRLSLEEVAAHPFFRHSLPRELPLWTMATAPVWGKDPHGHLVVLRPALDKATCTIAESWCCARFVSNGSQVPSPTLRNCSLGTTNNRLVDQQSVRAGDKDITFTYRLHDGTCGVCFADATQALATPGRDDWTFVDYHTVTIQPWSSTTGLSPTLRPKAQRLQQMLPRRQAEKRMSGRSICMDHICYLQQWARTPDASVFVMSHGSIQISFSDQWEIVVTSTGAVQARYASKSTVLPMDTERRMEYLQETLSKMSSEVMKERIKTPPRRIPRTPSLRRVRMIPLIPHKATAAPSGSLRSLLPKKLFADVVTSPKKKIGRPAYQPAVVVKAIPLKNFDCQMEKAHGESCIGNEKEQETVVKAIPLKNFEYQMEGLGKSCIGNQKEQETAHRATGSSKTTLLLSEEVSNDHDGPSLDEDEDYLLIEDSATSRLCLTSCVSVEDGHGTAAVTVGIIQGSTEIKPSLIPNDALFPPRPDADNTDDQKTAELHTIGVRPTEPSRNPEETHQSPLLETEHATIPNAKHDATIGPDNLDETSAICEDNISTDTSKDEMLASCSQRCVTLSNDVSAAPATDASAIEKGLAKHPEDITGATTPDPDLEPVGSRGELAFVNSSHGETVQPVGSTNLSPGNSRNDHAAFDEDAAATSDSLQCLLHCSPTTIVSLNNTSDTAVSIPQHNIKPSQRARDDESEQLAIVSQSDSDIESIEGNNYGVSRARLPQDNYEGYDETYESVRSNDLPGRFCGMTTTTNNDSDLQLSVCKDWGDIALKTANAELASSEVDQGAPEGANRESELKAD